MKRTDQVQGERLPDIDYFDQYKSREDAPGAFRKVTGFPESAVGYPSNLSATAAVESSDKEQGA